ncbi:MAG: bifunctional precorrin-2 dehydrogenase/sirohydrochlorin ferrochelatase [Lachnospiraceae bacterium]|nr:bifunctional precorrin-2 dehydrogenase/sirohydrochlorin ferrochelatase [Lachnospiraceae bacterium]
MSYFPMFIELKNRRCLVVGGGRIALHKVKVLEDFGAAVTVAAPEILPEIRERADVICREKKFDLADLDGQELVVAATNDAKLNSRISEACRRAGIPVNAVDQMQDCDFIFPAYLKEGEVVAAFSSGGQSPALTQYLKEQMRPVMTPLLGELAARLGEIRELVRRRTRSESERKRIYQELLRETLERESVFSGEEAEETIQKITGGNEDDGQTEKIES